MDTLSLSLHVLLAAILVGPQVLLFFAVVPATWLIDDESQRRAVMRVVTRRFGLLTIVAIAGLVLTGLYQFYSVVPEAIQEEMMDFRFGMVFVLKMTALVILVVLIAVHGMVFGRRIRAASEAVERGEMDAGALEHARRNSLLFSTLILLVSIAILIMGVTLGHHEYSYQAR